LSDHRRLAREDGCKPRKTKLRPEMYLLNAIVCDSFNICMSLAVVSLVLASRHFVHAFTQGLALDYFMAVLNMLTSYLLIRTWVGCIHIDCVLDLGSQYPD